MSINQFDAERFDSHRLINGFQLNVTTRDEVEAILGEPSHVNETDFAHTVEFMPMGNTARVSYRFRFDAETGIMNDVRMEFLNL